MMFQEDKNIENFVVDFFYKRVLKLNVHHYFSKLERISILMGEKKNEIKSSNSSL
jgi:hypothetical protein